MSSSSELNRTEFHNQQHRTNTLGVLPLAGVSRLLTSSFVLRPSQRPQLAFALRSRGSTSLSSTAIHVVKQWEIASSIIMKITFWVQHPSLSDFHHCRIHEFGATLWWRSDVNSSCWHQSRLENAAFYDKMILSTTYEHALATFSTTWENFTRRRATNNRASWSLSRHLWRGRPHSSTTENNNFVVPTFFQLCKRYNKSINQGAVLRCDSTPHVLNMLFDVQRCCNVALVPPKALSLGVCQRNSCSHNRHLVWQRERERWR